LLFLYCALLFYLIACILLRLTYSRRNFPTVIVLTLLVVVQLAMKMFDRYYLPSYSLRAGDELGWLERTSEYQKSGVIPYERIPGAQPFTEGPGIFYAVNFFAHILQVDYVSALVILALVFGTLYVLPAFRLYSELSHEPQVALSAAILVSMSDVMIYSTSIARPTLLGLFLFPLAMVTLQSLYLRFRWHLCLILLAISGLIIVVHTTITSLVLLLVVSSTLVWYDRLKKWHVAYCVTLFVLCGIAVSFMLPDLNILFRDELFSIHPLNEIATALNFNYPLLFALLGSLVMCIAFLFGKVRCSLLRAANHLHSSSQRFLVLFVVILAGFLSLAGVLFFKNYPTYIGAAYSSLTDFILLQIWKVPLAILAILGMWQVLRSEQRFCVAIPWFVGILICVSIMTLYWPYRTSSGLWNIDERIGEFLYYPAFYFVAVKLKSVSSLVTSRVFNWIIIPLICLFIIPSFIIGVHDTAFIQQYYP